jgi:hypothetical protein
MLSCGEAAPALLVVMRAESQGEQHMNSGTHLSGTMATIVTFPGAKERRQSGALEERAEVGKTAQLLLFTGVRYERHADYEPATTTLDPAADIPPVKERN